MNRSLGRQIRFQATVRRGNSLTVVFGPLPQTTHFGEKPITTDIVAATLAPDFDDLEPRLTRQGYSVKVLAEQFHAKPIEIRRFLNGQLDAGRTRELADRMRAVGLAL